MTSQFWYSSFLFLTVFSALSAGQDFDFFYFVQQWPGSFCDTQQGCCYPTSGKPAADFGIHGLWPNYNSGSYPSNCDTSSPFDESQIEDLIRGMRKNWPSLACPSSNGETFWSHEWAKHGTCSESILNQHQYFQAALALKSQANVLQALTNAGIEPNDGQYSLSSISSAIKEGTDYTAGIECNTDESGNSQLYQVYLCVDTSGASLLTVRCFPTANAPLKFNFPPFKDCWLKWMIYICTCVIQDVSDTRINETPIHTSSC